METYEMTQAEMLAAAKNAYVVRLKSTSACTRYAVYLQLDDCPRLKPLWPNADERNNNALLEYQVRAKRSQDDMPAYHFALNEVGTSRRFLLGQALRKHNPNLCVMGLEGGVPSTF